MAALDFLGIGAHKAGTTWLHRMLGLHPDIGLPPQKELHFWDKRWPAGESIERYEARFAGLARPIKGEITPAYAILPPTTIRVVHQRYPDLRLIYILRNPIERAWSHARMGYSKTVSQDTRDALDTRRDWFLQHFRSADSLLRGDYETSLRNWLAVYPQEQLLTRIQEEIFAAKCAFLVECCTHLGARGDFFVTVDPAVLEERVYPEIVIQKSQPSALPRDVPSFFVEPLLEIYAPRIRSLEDFMQRDLTRLWISPFQAK